MKKESLAANQENLWSPVKTGSCLIEPQRGRSFFLSIGRKKRAYVCADKVILQI